jgi:hypothetical protein
MNRLTAIVIILFCWSLAASVPGGAATLADCCLPPAPAQSQGHAGPAAPHDHGPGHGQHAALSAEAAEAGHHPGQNGPSGASPGDAPDESGYPACGLSACLKLQEASLQTLADPLPAPDPSNAMMPDDGPAASSGTLDSIFRPPRS